MKVEPREPVRKRFKIIKINIIDTKILKKGSIFLTKKLSISGIIRQIYPA